MSQQLELLVSEFGEVDDSEWPRVEREAIGHYSQLLRSYPAGPIDGSVTIRNIGRGADLSVVVLVVGGLFFTIPEAHKRVRESLEEWRRIFKEFKSVSSWLIGKKRALYPEQYLFLVALFSVVERTEPDALTFLGFTQLPEDDPDLSDKGALLFSFVHGSVVLQVAVARNGHFLWENELSLPAIEPNTSYMDSPRRSGM